MPLRLHLKKLLDVEVQFTNGQDNQENILVLKAKQIHATLTLFVAIYGLIFAIINYLFLLHYAAFFSMLCFIFASIAFFVYWKGYLLASKLINLTQLIVVISCLFYFPSAPFGPHSNDSVLAFFIPVSLGTIIVFQGKEKKYGYFFAIIILVIITTLIVLDRHYPEPDIIPNQDGFNTDLLTNILGSALATFAIIAYIVKLNNDLNSSLIKANMELDNFVYIVSHDLRSPLLSTSGLLELAKMRIDEREQVLKYLGLAGKSIANLDDIIREILAYSRNTRTGVEITEFDLKTMIGEICDALRYNAGNGFSFQEEYQGNSMIRCDKVRLHTVLRNIISNAVKYRNKNNNECFVKITVENTGNLYTIAVTDNGEGIPAESIDRVFEMFYRATSSAPGTGLGLYICKEVLTKMGADFHIESAPGTGTTFTITLKNK